MEGLMAKGTEDGFLRISNALHDALLKLGLTGTQWSILLWALRNTIGWNRDTTRFSWYGIAKELFLDRGGVSRAGNRLLVSKVLFLLDGQLGIEQDHREWDRRLFRSPCDDTRQLWMPGVGDDQRHRKPMTGNIASDDGSHPKRCQQSSLFRRAKDSSKDRLKTYKDRQSPQNDDARYRFGTTANTERRHLAGAAKPIPGKYDGLSQD
jgi:phage replication O-like protein O